MIPRRHDTRRRDVDHFIQRREHQHGRRRWHARPQGSRDRLAPDLLLQGLVLGKARFRGRDILDIPVGFQTAIHVATEEIAHLRLHIAGKHLDPQKGRADRVRLRRNQVTAILESRRGAGEREGEQQPQQCEDGAVDGTHALWQTFRDPREPRDAEAPSDFRSGEHRKQQALRTAAMSSS